MFVNRNPEYFLMIAREQNITRAAEKLFVTQSSLSQYISKLEVGLGVQLFDRTKSPIALTEAGQIYQRYLESSSYLYQKLIEDLNEDRLQNVTLGIGNWRGSILIPQILPEFLRTHPGVRVKLHEYPISELFAQVEDSRVDFAVMNVAPARVPSTLVSEQIMEERVLLVMRRDEPVAQEYQTAAQAGRPIDLSCLETMRYVALDSKLTVGRHIGNFLKQHHLAFPDSLSSTNNRTVLRLVAAGMGFCFMVEGGLQDSFGPDLIAFDLNCPELTLPLSFLYRPNAYRSSAAQALMEAIRTHCKGGAGQLEVVSLKM